MAEGLIFVEDRVIKDDKDIILVRHMTENKLLSSDIFGGPMCFARARYEYLKHSEPKKYEGLMRSGYMYEECRRAKLFIRKQYSELREKYISKNPYNYNTKNYFENLKLVNEAEIYAREIVNAYYVCSDEYYYIIRGLDFDEE